MDTSLLMSFCNETISRCVLANGLIVLIQANHSIDLLSTQLWIKTGSIYENKFLGSGISHFVEHMAFKGTRQRSFNDITQAIQAEGASINAYTTFDHTTYHVEGTATSLKTSLEILSDIAFNSTFPEEEFAKEKNVILREIDRTFDDPDNVVNQALFNTAFHVHAYQYPIIGKKTLFEKLTREHLLEYHLERYLPNNAVLVIAGNIDTQEALALAKQAFESHEDRYYSPPFIAQEPHQLVHRKQQFFGDYHIARGVMGFKIPPMTDSDAPGLDLLARVLGSGYSAILYQKLREETKLVHDIDVYCWNPKDTGLLCITYTCDPNKTQRVEATILKTIADLKANGFHRNHFERARQQSLVYEINSQKTIYSQASRLGLAEVVMGDYRYPISYLDILQNKTYEEVHSLLGKHLSENALTTVSLEPKQAKKALATPATKSQPLFLDFEEVALPNNARLLLQNWPHFPKTHLKVAFRGGPAYENPKHYGITHLLASLLTKDTQENSALAIAEQVENVGGSFTCFAGNNMFGLNLELLPNHVSKMFGLLQNALLTPAFHNTTFDKEVDGQVARIKELFDDPLSYGLWHLRQKFFGSHPYAHHALGTQQTLQKISIPHIIDHKEATIYAQNTVFAVSGIFDRNDIIDKFSAIAQGLPQAASPLVPNLPAIHLPAKKGTHTLEFPCEQTILFKAFPSIGFTDPNFEITDILAELLNGLSSNLFRKIREQQGLVYFIGANRVTGHQTSLFYIFAGTKAEHQEKVFSEIDQELQRLANGKIDPNELQMVKNRLKVEKASALQTPNSRTTNASLHALYGLPINHWKTYYDRINQFSPNDISEFAKKHFVQKDALSLVVKA